MRTSRNAFMGSWRNTNTLFTTNSWHIHPQHENKPRPELHIIVANGSNLRTRNESRGGRANINSIAKKAVQRQSRYGCIRRASNDMCKPEQEAGMDVERPGKGVFTLTLEKTAHVAEGNFIRRKASPEAGERTKPAISWQKTPC